MLNDSLYASDKDDWETPHDLFQTLDNEFNFTLDVCAYEHTAKCSLYFDVERDGLSCTWFGVCWMNPPFGRGVTGLWLQKAKHETTNGVTTVCLIPARTDSRWWHQYVMRSAEIRLLSRRLTFHGANNKAPFPVAIVVFRPGCDTPQLTAMFV